MVVVHRAHGYRFVHITGPGQAKINLLGPNGAPELVSSIGIKRSDMRRLFAEAVERRDEFLQAWERIHG
jgi:hypothetical protein